MLLSWLQLTTTLSTMSTQSTQATTEVAAPNNRGEQLVDNSTTPPATTEEVWQPKPLRPLTRKRQAFVKHLVDNPKASATQAVRATYNVTTDHSAEQIAHELLRKPEIRAELAKYEGKAEYNLMVLADKSTEYALTGTKEGASYAAVSERVNNSILDRLRGKATIRTEVKQSIVTLNIDLTGAVEQPQQG